MTGELKTHTLKVRLLSKGKKPEDAIRKRFAPWEERHAEDESSTEDDSPPEEEFRLEEHLWGGAQRGRLFIGQIYFRSPEWQSLIRKFSPDFSTDISSSGAGAVVFLPVGARVVAVCFGHIHIALDDQAFERQFGLKVTLNSVTRNKLRSIDVATPDAVTFQKRIQASKDSDLYEFGVDTFRDLARVAGGTPEDTKFASFVAGKDSLSITCKIEFEKTRKKSDEIHEKCKEIVKVYNKKSYRKEFGWVDNLQRTEDQDTITQLDKKLEKAINVLRSDKVNDLHMTPPGIVSYTEGSTLHYSGLGSRGAKFQSLSVSDYVSELNRCDFKGNISEIKQKHRVNARSDDEGDFSEKWRVYDCFVFETTQGSGARKLDYVLFAGDWYKVERSFKARVENDFNNITRATVVGKTTCRNEKELIAELQKSRTDLVKLDGTKINPLNVRYANLEPCDFFSKEREFIHLKDGHSSGPISHLWYQGFVSAEAFISDQEFRAKLRTKVEEEDDEFTKYLPKSTEEVVRKHYTVVYGIMREPYVTGHVDLPFFSKVSLQAIVESLKRLGIPVAIELIEKTVSDVDAEDDSDDVA